MTQADEAAAFDDGWAQAYGAFFSITLHPTPTLLSVAPSVHALTGYSADELLSDERLWQNLIVSDDFPRALDAWSKTRATGTAVVKGRLRHRRGHDLKVRVQLSLAQARQGDAGRVDGIAWRDLPLPAVLDELPDPVVVVDRAGVIVTANARVNLLGHTSESLVGQKVEVLVPPAQRGQHEKRHAPGELTQARRMGPGSFTAWTASGEELPVDISLGPIIGTPLVMAVLRDLRPVRSLELKAGALDRRYRTTFEQAAVGMVEVGLDGRWLTVNQRLVELTGFSEQELLTNPPSELGPALARALTVAQAADHPPVVTELNLTKKNGNQLWVRVTSAAARHSSGAPEYLVCVIEDIDLQRRSEALIHRSQRLEALGRLAGGVAHDFNNLLSVMLSYAESLSSDETMTADQRNQATEILSTANRGASLTRQLLSFSRNQELRVSALRCAEVLGKLDGLLKPLLGPAIHYSWSVPDEGLSVMADETQLEQVLMNLVVNARDAMQGGGDLRVLVRAAQLAPTPQNERPTGPVIAFDVIDNGSGIPASVLPHIFEPFFTTKEATKGTGLGLATVQAIVEKSGGVIEVTSEPGKTVFSVYLPAAMADDDTRAALAVEDSAPATPEALAQHVRVLLAEDDPAVRKLLHSILSRAGYDVTLAANGAEGLFLATKPGAHFDVIVTDVEMPLLGGIDLARRVWSEHPSKPVLFLSAGSDAMAEPTPAPWHRFLAKPFNRPQLLGALREVLSSGMETKNVVP